jgi:hypothetical protein
VVVWRLCRLTVAQVRAAELITSRVVATNVFAVLSCFALYLCLPNPYHGALDRLWAFLDGENAAYFEAKGVQFQNPACNGLTHIDLLVRRAEFAPAPAKEATAAGSRKHKPKRQRRRSKQSPDEPDDALQSAVSRSSDSDAGDSESDTDDVVSLSASTAPLIATI